MTITTAPTPLSYSGNGSTTAFAITWKYFSKSHVVATLRSATGTETTWVLNTNYTLTDAGVATGGTLTATVAPASGTTLVISLDPPNTQDSSLPIGGSFPSTTVEDELDEAAQRDGKLQALWDRALRVKRTDTRTGTDLELPIDTDRANKYLRFDANGRPAVVEGDTKLTGAVTGDVTATGTFLPTGDTSSGDSAAFGFTAAEGAILTGSGTTSDITLKNKSDVTAFTVPTGTTNVDIVGDVTALTVNADGDTSSGDSAAMGYTATEGLILTGQGSTNDVTIKNKSDVTVISIPTGGTQTNFGGIIQLGGNLNVNGNQIVSSSNGDINLNPNGTGQIQYRSVDIESLFRSHITGLVVSNNATDADHDIDVSAGTCSSDNQTIFIRTTSTITKLLDATFAEGTGNGGFASGEALPTSGTIHIWVIRKNDGTTDVFANNHDTSGLNPTLPAGFTTKRRISSMITDGAANLFHMRTTPLAGGAVKYDRATILQTTSLTNPGTSPTWSISNGPIGIKVRAQIISTVSNGDGINDVSVLITSEDQVNATPTMDMNTFYVGGITNDTAWGSTTMEVVTHPTNAAFRWRLSYSTVNVSIRNYSIGWIDDRLPA